MAAIIQVERDVNVRQADTGFWKPSLETSIYLSNRPVAAKIAADAIRKHWGIENKSHYDDIRRLRFRVIMHGANGDALTEKAPLYNLLKDLRARQIVAIGGDDTDLRRSTGTGLVTANLGKTGRMCGSDGSMC